MLFDFDTITLAALSIALFGAAFVRGYSGFGFSAIFIAFASLLTNPVPLVPVVFSCEILMTLVQARGIRGHIDWRRVLTMTAGAAVILPFSVWFILSTGETTARLVVSAIVLMMSLVLLTGWTIKRKIGAAGNAGIGMISGLFNAVGIGGLPVAAFMTAQPIAAATFRATMIVYLTCLDLITMPMMWAGGAVTWETAKAAAFAFPILLVGVLLGGRQFLSASPTTFRKFAVMLLLTLSVLGLVRVLL